MRHGRRERLVLEVAVGDAGLLHELGDPLRLGDGARERLLAGDSGELALAPVHGVHDLFDVFDAREVRPAQPQRADPRVRDHLGDRAVRLRRTDVELAGESRRLLGMLLVRAPHAHHVRVPHRLERLQVKPGVESAADEPDAQSLLHARAPSQTRRGGRVMRS